jgi:hypothetical protein
MHADKNISEYKTNIIHLILHINVVGWIFSLAFYQQSNVLKIYNKRHETINISSRLWSYWRYK